MARFIIVTSIALVAAGAAVMLRPAHEPDHAEIAAAFRAGPPGPSGRCAQSPACVAGFRWAQGNGINESRQCIAAGAFQAGCLELVGEHLEAQAADGSLGL